MDDLLEHAIDQDSPWGTFTRLTPPVAFSHTPSMVTRAPAWPGTDPDTIGGGVVSLVSTAEAVEAELKEYAGGPGARTSQRPTRRGRSPRAGM
jgi:hypothetical protein